MKKNKLLLLLIVLLTTVSLTSCLGDGDDSGRPQLPTKEERDAAFNVMKGNYQGKLICFSRNQQTGGWEKKDSTDIHWEMTSDTCLLVKQFPTKYLAKSVKNASLKQAIEALPAQDLKFKFSIYWAKPTATGFYVVPLLADLGNLTYDGASHRIAVRFIWNSTVRGLFDPSTKRMAAQFIENGIYVDNALKDDVYFDGNIYQVHTN